VVGNRFIWGLLKIKGRRVTGGFTATMRGEWGSSCSQVWIGLEHRQVGKIALKRLVHLVSMVCSQMVPGTARFRIFEFHL
jgi:hypothetical protein